jgi:hypothetical protein
MACSTNNSAACLLGWSQSAWGMAGILFWAISWVRTCIPWPAAVSSSWSRMWSAGEPAAWVGVVLR